MHVHVHVLSLRSSPALESWLLRFDKLYLSVCALLEVRLDLDKVCVQGWPCVTATHS